MLIEQNVNVIIIRVSIPIVIVSKNLEQLARMLSINVISDIILRSFHYCSSESIQCMHTIPLVSGDRSNSL
jgi:hypothetical protein